MPAHTPKYSIGDPVFVGLGVKDAVILRLVKKGRKPETTMYLVEYTVDDGLERTNPTGRRHCQPWMEHKIIPRTV